MALARRARLNDRPKVDARAAGAAGQPVLLINPRSFRASRWGLARRAARLAARTGIETITASDPEQWRDAFNRLRERGQQHIWVLGGDGTIQWIIEYLAQCREGFAPALLLLGGGRANVVPRECGGYPALRALRRAIAAHRAGRPLPRGSLCTLRLSQPGVPARHGFFLAGGMVHEGVRVCSEHRERGSGWLHRSLAADFYALLKLLVLVAIGRSPLPPYELMSVRMAGGPGLGNVPMRVLLATTLGMRRALYNPFAANGEGPVRVTAIAATAPHFWRHLPGILRGRFAAGLTAARGVLSGQAATVELQGMSACSLDGEAVRFDPLRPVQLEPGFTLTVLLP